MYHVGLDLTEAQHEQLKMLAIVEKKPIRALVTDLVVKKLEQAARAGRIPKIEPEA